MQAIAEFWVSLGVMGQSVVIGGIIFGIMKFVQWKWPNVKVARNDLKRTLIALGAGLSAIAATGDVWAGVVAALSAFGMYDVTSTKKAE